mgnify:FL=1
MLPKDIESLGVTVTDDLVNTLKWCDAVNMLRIQNERTDVKFFPSNREYSKLFGLDREKFNKVKKDIFKS